MFIFNNSPSENFHWYIYLSLCFLFKYSSLTLLLLCYLVLVVHHIFPIIMYKTFLFVRDYPFSWGIFIMIFFCIQKFISISRMIMSANQPFPLPFSQTSLYTLFDCFFLCDTQVSQSIHLSFFFLLLPF